jgi:hypothetical protein
MRGRTTKNLGRGAASRLGASHGPNRAGFFAPLRMTSVINVRTEY